MYFSNFAISSTEGKDFLAGFSYGLVYTLKSLKMPRYLLTHSTLRPGYARAGLSAVPSCLCAIHVRDTCSLDTDLRSIKGMDTGVEL